MKLTKDQVKHIAKLANLTLSDTELEKFAGQLGETLTYVEQLDAVDTKGIEPTSQVTGLLNITRPDEIATSLTEEQVLQNTKSKEKGFFKVLSVFVDND